ncbi:MAG: HDOD domain-containing protein [Pseudomonadota bacterium]
MAKDLKSFAKEIAEKPIFVPERAFKTCQLAIKNSRKSLSVASDIITQDPGLCMWVLRHVNRSRSKNSDRLEITSVMSALNLLGDQAAKQLIGRVDVLEHKITDRAVASVYSNLLDRMLHVSTFAERWAQLRGDQSASELRIAGLLRNIGELAVCAHHHEDYLAISKKAATPNTSLTSAAREVLGFSFDELSVELTQLWHLPELVADSNRCERLDVYRPQGVMLAAECTRLAEYGWFHSDMNICQEMIADYLNLDGVRTARLLHKTVLAIAQSNTLHAPSRFAAALVQISGDSRMRATRLVQPERAPSINRARQREHDTAVKLQRAKIFAKTVQVLKASTSNPNTSATDIVRCLLTGLHKGVGFSRVMFAMLDTGGDSMSVKLARGVDFDTARAMVLPCKDHTLFSSLMKSPKSMWINQNTFVKFQPLIPDAFCLQAGTQDFLCGSLFCGQRPIGLVYADQVGGDTPIDDRSFQHAKSLIQFAAKSLTIVENERRAARKSKKKVVPATASSNAKPKSASGGSEGVSVKQMSDRLINQRVQAAAHRK